MILAQQEVDRCRSSLDAIVAELISVQERLDIAKFEMPIAHPTTSQAQQSISSTMKLAQLAVQAQCISSVEQAMLAGLLQRMTSGISQAATPAAPVRRQVLTSQPPW